ncbi:MAG: EAL domain-containing protein [Rhodoferax sp.]|uniref:EAL domain-containing protein n=1 Tax=Rhodoferax sp. TaxID=50421 RepID=UPI0032678558
MLLTILPAVLLVVYQAGNNRKDAIAAAEERARLTVHTLAASQQRLINNTQQFLHKLADMPEAQRPAAPECSHFLAEVLSLNSTYVNLGIPLADGSLLCNATPLKAPVNVADRPYIRQALSAREFSVGTFQLDRVTRTPSINFAYPVTHPANQQVIGAVVAVLSLDWWSRRLADLSLPDGAVARVTDPSGYVIARFPPEPTELGLTFYDADFSNVLSHPHEDGVLLRRDSMGARQLVVFKPLLESDGKAIATMSLTLPLEELYAAANQRMWNDIGFLLAGVLATFVLAQMAIRRAVVNPLRQLLDATDQLAQGRYVSDLPTTGTHELAELAERFNRMAVMRQNAEAQLRQSEESLSITLHSIGDAVVATDAEGKITRMNGVAERLTGWSLSEAAGRPLSSVFRIVNASTREPVVDPVQLVMARGDVVGLANHTALLARSGAEYQIADSAAPIRNAHGQIVGVVLVFSDVSESYRVHRQLEENEARFRILSALSSDWYWEQDAQFRFVRFEGNAQAQLDKKNISPYGQTRWDAPALNVTEAQWEQHKLLLQQHQPFHDFEIQRVDIKDGLPYWISVSGTPIFDDHGQFCGYHGIGKDVTARKHAENELRIAAIAFESQEGVLVTDSHAVVLRANHAFTKITGYSAEEAIGQSVRMLSSGQHDADFFASMYESLQNTQEWQGEIWNRRKDGTVCLYYMSITGVLDADGHLTHYVCTLVDVTQKVAAAKEIEQLAFYDALTHLPNRRLMQDRLQQAFASSIRTGKQGALLCLDLDHFKNLNDTLGHDMGDVLLQQVAQRLIACVREGDTVARFGGDEFLVLLEDLSLYAQEAAEQTQHIGEKILAALNQPYQLASHHVLSTPSVGAVLFNGQTQAMEELVKYADLAMYAAKNAGRNAIRFFDPMMQAAVTARAALESDLRTAVAEQQFQLYYQVQLTHRRQAVGAEVLIRWLHPTRGMVSPFDFIPLAEETGLILPIGLWVLETACAQLRRWQDDPAKADLQLAVNVSARQFRQPDFTEQVCAVLQHTGARPDRLKLELTESLALDNVGDTITKMKALRALGLRFSMDDFGTGQSSLSYLTRLPLDQLKIDQSFVRNIGIQHTDALIVQTIIGMAHSLGLEVIAEGVETEPQRAFLEQHGCPLCQGYLFSRPVPLEEFERLLSGY